MHLERKNMNIMREVLGIHHTKWQPEKSSLIYEQLETQKKGERIKQKNI